MLTLGMLQPSRIRQLCAYAGVLLAAGASIATSQNVPALSDQISGDQRLTADRPETALHFTVDSSEAHRVTFEAIASPTDSVVSVQIRLTSDDTGESVEDVFAVSDTGDMGAAIGIDDPCTSSCGGGYTALISLVNPSDGDTADIDWTVHGRVDDSDRAPKDAFIDVNED